MFYFILTIFGISIGILIVALIAKNSTHLSVIECLLPNKYVAWRYFLFPVITVALSWLLYLHFKSLGMDLKGDFNIFTGLRFLAGLLLVSALAALAIEGFTRDNVPNLLTIPGIIAGCLFALFVPGLSGNLGIPYLPSAFNSLLYNCLGCALGFVVYWVLHRFNKEGMGLGNAKLAGMLGAFLGLTKLLVVIFLSSIFGGIIAFILLALKSLWTTVSEELKRAFNYSSIIALTGLIVFFFGDNIIAVYSSFVKRERDTPNNPIFTLISSLEVVICVVILVWILYLRRRNKR